MEVEGAADRGADLLMECDEEEQEEEGHGETVDKDTAPPPVRIVPIPVQAVNSSSRPKLHHLVTLSGAPVGFRVNGQLVRLLPGGGGVELKLRSHPGGSASSFTSVLIPPTEPPPPPADHTPVITGVVSGEAAQKVLSSHSVNFQPGASPPCLTSPWVTPSASRGVEPCHKLLRRGELGPVSPPDCFVCMSQYKLITELRGFMCLCSPAIAAGLKHLKKKRKKKNLCRRGRDQNKTARTNKTSRTSGLSAVCPLQSKGVLPVLKPCDDFLSDRFSPPVSSVSPHQVQSEPLCGKLVIMVEDFYYGSAPGQSSVRGNVTGRKFTGPYRCIHCPTTLHNNITLMSHMQHHVSTMSQEDGHTCPHCFRSFLSPFKLQCHLEAVHSQYESTALCKICELDFGSEPALLWHMKNTHKPGEMPYTCQVCDFRSSFFSDVWTHFERAHSDSKHLLCQYCLRVLRSNTCYQQHFARHQRKHVFSCDKCRLHFLYVKDRIEHKQLHHRTHVRPPQLTGLRPGTKVTVRTYSVVGGDLKRRAPCKVVEVDPAPPTQAPRRRPVQSLGRLLCSLSQDSQALSVSQLCVECLSLVLDFRTHFPSLVHCSLCSFITCCSTAYANHMISNHTVCRKTPQYQNIFLSDPRLSHRLTCVSCTFSTCRGDVMANHLTERPEHHHCVTTTHTESSVESADDSSRCVTSSVSQGGGAFVPIHLVPSSGQSSAQLSVKALTSTSPLSSPPAMTIKFLGPRPQPDQCPLSASQLAAVLSSLTHGVAQASIRYRTPPLTIRSWTRREELQLWDRKWRWRTEKLVQWVLHQREQQLSVSEDVLLQMASRVLGDHAQLTERYRWSVHFLLRHDLDLNNLYRRGRLPRVVMETSRTFISTLRQKLLSRPPRSVASMDEFSIFLDLDLFSRQDPLALQLFGSGAVRPVFDVVLSALSDGTLLRPLLFFRGRSSNVPEGFPDNVLLEARQDGFTDRDRLRVWTDKVWRPHVSSQRDCVLMLDVHRGHMTDALRDALSSVNTNVVFLPSGCCCRLQPLNVCVTPVLRDFLQAQWTQLVSQGGLDGLGLDQLALTLACWLSELSWTVNSDTRILRRSFAAACNLQEDRGEVARAVQTLTEALLRPPAQPEPELELLLVMEKKKKEMEEEKEEESGRSALRQVFDGDSDQETFHGFYDD